MVKKQHIFAFFRFLIKFLHVILTLCLIFILFIYLLIAALPYIIHPERQYYQMEKLTDNVYLYVIKSDLYYYYLRSSPLKPNQISTLTDPILGTVKPTVKTSIIEEPHDAPLHILFNYDGYVDVVRSKSFLNDSKHPQKIHLEFHLKNTL